MYFAFVRVCVTSACACAGLVGGQACVRVCVHTMQSDRLVVWVLLLLQQQPSTSLYRCSPAVIAFAEGSLEQQYIEVWCSGQNTINAEKCTCQTEAAWGLPPPPKLAAPQSTHCPAERQRPRHCLHAQALRTHSLAHSSCCSLIIDSYRSLTPALSSFQPNVSMLLCWLCRNC